jgi:hypothetical protein
MYHNALRWKSTDISEERIATVFRVWTRWTSMEQAAIRALCAGFLLKLILDPENCYSETSTEETGLVCIPEDRNLQGFI